MKKLLKFNQLKIKYIIFIYVALQLALIFTHDIKYRSDALYYYSLAEKCIQQNQFYPSPLNMNDDYIVAPLYINSIILVLKIYNSPLTISFFNLLIILFQLYACYKITLILFSEKAAKLSILLYVFYLNTLALLLQNYTELLFVLLITYSIYFFMLKRNIFLLISGIISGAAIAVRPIGWAILISVLIVHIMLIYKSKKFKINYLYYYSGVFLFIILFGTVTYTHFGKFEYTSTTGPINLLLGANDDATGGFNSTVLEKGNAGYIENTDSLTYLQKDEFYWTKAISWIFDHPGKWLLLAPIKLLHTFGWDDVSLSSLLGMPDVNFARVMKIILLEFNFEKALPNSSTNFKIFYLAVMILHHLFYYCLLFAIVASMYIYTKEKIFNENISLILTFAVVIVLMIMITVGSPRYKYPIFILLLPFAANYLVLKFNLGRKVIA